MALTLDNYRRGFLVDEELMAGVSENPDQPGTYVAFVLRHTTGEYLGVQNFGALSQALEAINRIPRAWAYETSGGCGGCGDGSCGKEGGGCGLKRAGGESACSSGKCAPSAAPTRQI